MCKLIIAVALLAVAAYAAPPSPPSADEIKAEMVKAGMSDSVAAAIIAIGEKYKDQLEGAKGDKDAAKKVFDEIKTDTDAYIKTQSETEQKAYESFVESKKKEFEGHHSTPAH
ncbi:unnamed protein product [Caenorhabditis brenneri]